MILRIGLQRFQHQLRGIFLLLPAKLAGDELKAELAGKAHEQGKNRLPARPPSQTP